MTESSGRPERLCFVDCEAIGASPSTGRMTEFGAVSYPSGKEFHGHDDSAETFKAFAAWLAKTFEGRIVFVSDNPAFDWQWINDGFHKHLGSNPFGHSARRISDFYAGLRGNFYDTQQWKRLRQTPHDHNPIHDARGNMEAFVRILKGDR